VLDAVIDDLELALRPAGRETPDPAA
jgi:hypothetical protein